MRSARPRERAGFRSGASLFGLAGCVAWLGAHPLQAAEAGPAPGVIEGLTGLDTASAGVWLRGVVLVTVLGVVPSFVLLMTSYPRIFIVLSFLRRALGTPELPPQQVLAGLALILTGFVMLPVWRQVHAEAYAPFSRGELKTPEEALEKAARPIKSFLLAHTFEKDLKLFVELSEPHAGRVGPSPRGAREPDATAATVEELSFFIVFPAFVLSELKTAFQIGFLIYLPFLVIDLAVSAVLLSMGMFLLPPALVSLPLKVLVFVLVDGWDLVVVQLVRGFQVL